MSKYWPGVIFTELGHNGSWDGPRSLLALLCGPSLSQLSVPAMRKPSTIIQVPKKMSVVSVTVLTWWTTCTLWPAEANRILIIIIIIIVIMYIYHVLINTMSAHTIHINLNRIFYKHAEHSPTKTIYVKYCGSQGLGLEPNKDLIRT